MILYGNDGNRYQIEDKAFKTGGEATLHEIKNHPEWVAKLYNCLLYTSDAADE